MVNLDPLPPRTKIGELSSSAKRRASQEAPNGIPDMIGMEGRLFKSKPIPDRSMLLGMKTQTNVPKRGSGLQEAGTARKLARTIQLLRDRAIMDSLSMSDLLDHTVIDSIWASLLYSK